MKQFLARAVVFGAIAAAALVSTGTAGAADYTLKYAFSATDAGGNATNTAASLAALDPARANRQIQFQVLYMTCANLFNHPDVDLQNGGRAVPEVADPNYNVSSDGLTYTFTLRSGYTFSDGTPVTASAYATEINRLKDVTVASPFASYAADMTPTALDATTLKITLSAPHGDLLDRLAMPIFCPVPPGTGTSATTPPASGPYKVGTTSSGSALTLVRNPNYTGTRPRNPNSIEFISVATPSDSYAGLNASPSTYDVADLMSDAGYASAGSTWGPGTTNAQQGSQRFFVQPNNQLNYFALNSSGTHVLSNPNLRLAVNYAIDRNALVQGASPYALAPWSQYLTPGIPGFTQAANAVSLSPQLATAQSLVDTSGVAKPISLTMYCAGSTTGPNCTRASQVKTNLDAVGFNVTVMPISSFLYFSKIANPNEPFDIASVGWIVDYFDPGNFIVPLLRTGSSANSSHWDSSSSTDANGVTWTQRMDNASALPAPDRYTAFAQLAPELAGGPAPIAAWAHGNWRFFFSDRLGCQTVNPVYGVALGSLCIPDVSQPVTPNQPVSSGSTVSASDPVATSVTSPVGGTVSITETSTLNEVAPSGYSFFRQQVTIEAPQATTAAPLQITFLVDTTLLGGSDPSSVVVFRDGAPLPSCSNASPPCLLSSTLDNGTGPLRLTVLTDHASNWNFGKKFAISDFKQPVDNGGTFNKMKAGAAVPVKFSLGGNLGLSIFTGGYPKSVPVACPSSSSVVDAVEETVAADNSSLSYDVAGNQYTYTWKTQKAWAGTCRQLVLQFADVGETERVANFQFTK